MIPPRPAASLQIGFLSILSEPGGVLGGYLVTNSWGRPLEFRLSSAVQPNRVQQILYADTLPTYLHADLIGRTLIEKSTTPAELLITDSVLALELQSRFAGPVLWLASADDPLAIERANRGEALRPGQPPRCGPLLGHPHCLDQRESVRELLDRIDAALDLAEPFQRIREAIGEARKNGGPLRAA